MFDDFDYAPRSTDDFYTYNGFTEPEGGRLTQAEIDGYDESQGPWDFDPFGPDSEIWRELDEM